MKDSYYSIEGKSTGLFKDRSSKFFAFAFPCVKMDDFDLNLAEIKKEHPKARHHCFAYRMGIDGEDYRANDDGEPSGTAGLPILGQLKSYNIVNVAIIVTRYFGGTKLGVSGLINAYKTAAKLSIESASIVEKIVAIQHQLIFDYAMMGHLMNCLKQLKITIISKSFDQSPSLIIKIRKSKEQEELVKLKSKILEISVEEFESKELDCGVEFIKIDPC